MAGIRDVAKKANVSISTVSLVLNNNGYVSDETRENVMRAVEELKYIPNELARNLYKNRTNIVGVIVPDIQHPFFCAFTKHVETELYKKGFKTMLCSSVKEENGEKEYIDMLKRQIMDGIIMGTHTLDVQAYQGLNKPIVSLDRYINDAIPLVRSDHSKGGYLAGMEFVRCGCKAVLQIMGDSRVNTPAHEYHYSLNKTLAEYGIKTHQVNMTWNQWDFDSFVEEVKQGILQYPELDGIFGADQAAMAALGIAAERGLKVPENLKIIAYDGTVITRMIPIGITSIQQNIEKLAKISVDLLVKQINGKEIKKREHILDVELIKRGTT